MEREVPGMMFDRIGDGAQAVKTDRGIGKCIPYPETRDFQL